MLNRHPPLLTLRAFEAAARNLSFTLAAAELHVTQSAISRQIRMLEDFLGQKLFERFTRRIELTDGGSEYFRAIHSALAGIEEATQRAMCARPHSSITVNVMTTLATAWLMPRLASFSETYPGIEVRLICSIAPVAFHSDDVDVAIRVGRLPGAPRKRELPRIELEMVSSWKGIIAEYLFPDVLVPVVSRKLIEQGPPIDGPADLLKYPLIHMATRPHAWHDWLAAHGLRIPAHADSVHYGHFFMGLRAAQNSKGVAIVPSVILRNFLAGPDLVCPLPGDVESAGSYYLLTREDSRRDKAIQTFCNWLLSEAARELDDAELLSPAAFGHGPRNRAA
ncbi:LysR family transcriptional regulator [Burkholderia multivorans]|uniref:LysR substrate-binding domain-containing protein n=1 Tax=Burkholderia multivorans TaxID=87883 RepID=UPI000CFF8AD2|nr:LysR substrate-binding domain-containing protein [Burkholderia multivorans]MBU9651098.1 LysR family transcriptional regulator [Burkholderia multivorans]PRG69720.1 LysR family transcriptional regulator [Burkholderia multivorans]